MTRTRRIGSNHVGRQCHLFRLVMVHACLFPAAIMSGDLYRKLDGALSQLHITNSTPQGYSSTETRQRKVAPVVPPKPKKNQLQVW